MGAIMVAVVTTEVVIVLAYLLSLSIVGPHYQFVINILLVIALLFPVAFYHHSWSIWLAFDHFIEGLPNARHLVLPGQGHSVLGTGCMPKLFAQFIEKADATTLDAKCLDQLAYVPPFTSFNGWEP